MQASAYEAIACLICRSLHILKNFYIKSAQLLIKNVKFINIANTMHSLKWIWLPNYVVDFKLLSVELQSYKEIAES